MPLLRLSSALAASGSLARIVDGQADADPAHREDAVRAVGALRLEAAVPWLRTLLGANESRVRLRAARALGRIGGVRGADALVAALRARRIPVNRLVIELARAAPDLYIETMLVDPRQAGIRASLVAAAGLRRRRGSLTALRQLAGSGTERERVAACSALWRLRDAASPAAIGPALEHRSWRVRRAACRALGQLGDRTHLPELYRGLNDPHPKARIAAARALRRLGEAIQA
jgi:HEAT repeat protein